MPISGRVNAAAIKATLAAMPDIVRQAMGDAIQMTGSEMVRAAKGTVKVETGTLRDHIGFSYSPTYCRVKVGITPGIVVAKVPGSGPKAKPRAYRATHYAHLVEFTHHEPFLGPAFEGQQGPLDSRMQAAQRATLDDLAHVGSSFL